MQLEDSYTRLLRLSRYVLGREIRLRWRPLLYEVAQELDSHRRLPCADCRRRVRVGHLHWSHLDFSPHAAGRVLARCEQCWHVAGIPSELPEYPRDREQAASRADRQRLLLTRWRLKAENRAFYQTALAILRHYDPMLIALYDPGEYEPEVDTILPRARTVATRGELLRVIQEEFRWWFGEDAAATLAYDRIASDFWAACLRHRWSSAHTDIA